MGSCPRLLCLKVPIMYKMYRSMAWLCHLLWPKIWVNMNGYVAVAVVGNLQGEQDRYINSSPPSAQYMRRWTGSTLVQVMSWSQETTSPCLNQCLFIDNWTIRNKCHWQLNRNSNMFTQENAFENIVCEIAAILSRGRWVNMRKWPPSRTQHF